MSEQEGRPAGSRWLVPSILVLLGMQLGLLYLQGGLLHRQSNDIRALREDVQYLSELIESGTSEGAAWHPGHGKGKPQLQKASFILEEDPEPAVREVEESRKSGQKAVQEAKEVRQKVDIQAHAQKVEEKARMKEAQSSWSPLVAIALGVLAVALVARVLVRRRG